MIVFVTLSCASLLITLWLGCPGSSCGCWPYYPTWGLFPGTPVIPPAGPCPCWMTARVNGACVAKLAHIKCALPFIKLPTHCQFIWLWRTAATVNLFLGSGTNSTSSSCDVSFLIMAFLALPEKYKLVSSKAHLRFPVEAALSLKASSYNLQAGSSYSLCACMMAIYVSRSRTAKLSGQHCHINSKAPDPLCNWLNRLFSWPDHFQYRLWFQFRLYELPILKSFDVTS